MKWVSLVLGAALISGCAGNTAMEGERVSIERDGRVDVCGEGDGLPKCRDYNNLTYDENLEYKAPTDTQMEEEAAKIRSESPEELERTLRGLEHDPELIDSMAD